MTDGGDVLQQDGANLKPPPLPPETFLHEKPRISPGEPSSQEKILFSEDPGGGEGLQTQRRPLNTFKILYTVFSGCQLG